MISGDRGGGAYRRGWRCGYASAVLKPKLRISLEVYMVIVLSTDFIKEKVEEYILHCTTTSASRATAAMAAAAGGAGGRSLETAVLRTLDTRPPALAA